MGPSPRRSLTLGLVMLQEYGALAKMTFGVLLFQGAPSCSHQWFQTWQREHVGCGPAERGVTAEACAQPLRTPYCEAASDRGARRCLTRVGRFLPSTHAIVTLDPANLLQQLTLTVAIRGGMVIVLDGYTPLSPDGSSDDVLIIVTKDTRVLNLRTCPYSLMWQRGLCRCDLVKDLEMRRSSWIIHLGPM